MGMQGMRSHLHSWKIDDYLGKKIQYLGKLDSSIDISANCNHLGKFQKLKSNLGKLGGFIKVLGKIRNT